MTRKPEDTQAASIEFGVELETLVPIDSGIAVGPYHVGHPVRSGVDAKTREHVIPPSYDGGFWRAERDASIALEAGYHACEFVSPVLKGEAGVISLAGFIAFASRIGAKVNATCGCHVTVGVANVIGTSDERAIAQFLRRLTRLCNQYTWAIYAQTGAARHLSQYAKRLPVNAGTITNDMLWAADKQQREKLATDCGRGIVNFKKAFPPALDKSAVELRAFAGTLNADKVLHHVATALGLMRRAATAKVVPVFTQPHTKPPESAPAALEAMWTALGWMGDGPGVDRALGLFGTLWETFPAYSQTALKMAKKFEQKHPKANL